LETGVAERRILKQALYAIMAISAFLSVCPIVSQAQESAETQQKKVEPQKGKYSIRYGLFVKITTRPGKRDAVVAILLRDVEKAKAASCDLYVVNLAPNNPDVVLVSEVWTSREAHRASLQLTSVKQAIAEAFPMLTGEFEQIEVDVVGGLGLPARPDPADSK
jgi:quinol monooxygenase YgiN